LILKRVAIVLLELCKFINYKDNMIVMERKKDWGKCLSRFIKLAHLITKNILFLESTIILKCLSLQYKKLLKYLIGEMFTLLRATSLSTLDQHSKESFQE